MSLRMLFLSLMTAVLTVPASAQLQISGSYLLPVDDPALIPYADFDINVKWDSEVPGQRAFRYRLPRIVDGVANAIELREVSPSRFEGPKAVAECGDGARPVCHVKYRHLQVDPLLAEHLINVTFPNEFERNARVEIMRRFTNDPEPIGIVTTGARLPGDSEEP